MGADWLESLEDTLLRLGDGNPDLGFWNRDDFCAANLDVGCFACDVGLGRRHCILADGRKADGRKSNAKQSC